MNEEGAFLRAIAEAPGDELAHLVFADWLEENGSSDRSDLIRMQVQSARLGETDPQRQQMRKREREIIARLASQWIPEYPGPRVLGFNFRLGIPWQAVIRASRGIDHPCIAALEPLPITSLVLTDLARSAQFPVDHAPRSDQPQVGGPDIAQTWAEVFRESSWFPRIRELVMCGNLDPAVRRALYSASTLSGIRSLALRDVDEIEGVQLGEILRGPGLAALESLRLSSTSWQGSPTPGDIFRDSPIRLKELSVVGNVSLRFDLPEVLRSPSLESMESLELSSGHVEREIGRLLGSSHMVRNLKTLRINYSELGDAGAHSILRSRNLRNLRCLTLASSKVSAASFSRVPKTGGPKLEEVDLSVNPIFDDGLRALIGWKAFDTVRFLNLRTTFLSAAGLKELVFSEAAANLEWIDLGNNDLGNAGLKVLTAHAERLPKLRWLKLASNGIRGPVSRLIQDTPWPSQLQGLDLWNNPLSAPTVAELRKTFGDRLAFED